MLIALALYLFFIPVSASVSPVSAPITNPFNKFHELEFIQHQFRAYLPLNERVKFMLTCRGYYKYLEAEYDSILQAIGIPNSFKTANKALRADIIKIYKYFHLENEFRNVHEAFSIETLYKMIDGCYFKFPLIRSMITDENVDKFQSICVTKDLYPGYNRIKLTAGDIQLPEIFLLLLKSDPSQDKRDILINAACQAPFFNNEFFKHFALDVFKINRIDLYPKVNEVLRAPQSDPEVYIVLKQYEQILDQAYFYFATESFIISIISTTFLYIELRKFVHIPLLSVLTVLLLVVTVKAIEFHYKWRYANFASYSHYALWRYLTICKYMEYIAKHLKYD